MPAAPVVAVAASGGRDSTALLHCTAHAARALGIEVHALHVHHGLQAAADGWLRQVQAQCRRWARQGLPLHFHSRRLIGQPAPGESVEAWARRERYQALAGMARAAGCSRVLLAHHRRDQAETFVLQALRGAGPAGLSAMPSAATRGGIAWLRPWLDHPREAIEHYLRRHRLAYIDDTSNADPRFARNRLRLTAWPALTAAFGDAENCLAHAAQRAQEAAACLVELADIDLRATRTDDDALPSAAWQALSPARRANLLRAWLVRTTGGPVPDTLVQRLLQELPECRTGRWQTPAGELRLYRGQLRHAAASTAPTPTPSAAEPRPLQIALGRPGCYPLPAWGGALHVESVDHGGVAAADLTTVELRPRRGGEQFQLAPNALPRSLKKQYQTLAVPAWQRCGPLLYSQGRLLFVPGLGLDARHLAGRGEPQWQLSWQPSEPASGNTGIADGSGV